MTNPRNQTLFAFLDATNSLFLSSQADYSNALGAKDPDVSFSPGNNSLTITIGDNNPTDFCFSGFSVNGVNPGSTPQNPVYSAAAAGELNSFSVTVTANQITIEDNAPSGNQSEMDYEYTIYCQRLSDGAPFADDPRIINQTGGGG